MAFTVQADSFRFKPELRSGVAGKRVLITGAGKDRGLGQAFALAAGLNGAAKVGVHFHSSYVDAFDLVAELRKEESSAYRADFQNAFTKGGWKVAIDISDDIPEGVCSNFMRTISNSQKQPNPKQPNAEELLIEAFRQARIQLNQRSGGSGQGISNDSLTLTIGRRRVDDSDIRGREATMEMYNRLLKETEQDD